MFARWIALTLAILLTTYLLPPALVELRGDRFIVAVVAALVLGLVNTFVRPIVALIALPITVLTLGLFALVINALMIYLVDLIVPGFIVHGLWGAFLASLIISLISVVLTRMLSRE